GVHHSTVGSVRASLEGRGEISHVETRTDTKGRKQPGRKSRPKPRRRSLWRLSANSVTPPIDEESAQPVPRKFTPNETPTNITWAIKALCHAIEGTAPAEVVAGLAPAALVKLARDSRHASAWLRSLQVAAASAATGASNHPADNSGDVPLQLELFLHQD